MADLGTLGVAGAGVGLAVGLWRATPWLLGTAYASCAAGVFPAAAAGAAGAPLLGGFAAWQWLSAGAFAANVASVSVPGRIDGKMAEEARKARADGASKDDAPGVPRDSRYRSLVTPAGWAFSIWGIIFSGEAIFAAAQAMPAAGSSSFSVFAGLAPWWALACGLQSLWCAAFRPWAQSPRHFWLSPALLATEAVALGGAHHVLRAAVQSGAMTTATYFTAHVPLSLHFGWITAASVVSLNSLAALTLSLPAQLATAFASVVGSAVVGTGVTVVTGDPLYALTLAWALSGVASDGGKRCKEVLGEVPLEALTMTASAGARALVAVALGTCAAGWWMSKY
eukprot:CAMPEP_0177777698 /NCGR_PEP_ID=MMETSP0491_2-20121128/15526_1 /TAXON_ID=63592 /ORGANISM="Tetraselmis chuii, Strain PLY429" /LENGTH=338 /DNA_ID=CAMNT_0019296855 /DNA_START=77 /DNA_END=1093 /DNA_ORIENTATION=+